MPPAARRADVGVIGGSGLYQLLDGSDDLDVPTPYGPPSSPIALGRSGGRTVAFLARHGRRHTIPPHRIDYRANLWALASLGVRAVVSPFACGSLRSGLDPGHMVVVDQLVDRTRHRVDTFHDGPDVRHVSFADPYDPALSAVVADAAEAAGVTVRRGGTVAVIEGPRFSTRAESRWLRSLGADVVNMTQYPEAALAAELSLPFCGMGLVTDHDSGLDDRPDVSAVTMDDVLAVLDANAVTIRRVLTDALAELPLHPA